MEEVIIVREKSYTDETQLLLSLCSSSVYISVLLLTDLKFLHSSPDVYTANASSYVFNVIVNLCIGIVY